MRQTGLSAVWADTAVCSPLISFCHLRCSPIRSSPSILFSFLLGPDIVSLPLLVCSPPLFFISSFHFPSLSLHLVSCSSGSVFPRSLSSATIAFIVPSIQSRRWPVWLVCPLHFTSPCLLAIHTFLSFSSPACSSFHFVSSLSLLHTLHCPSPHCFSSFIASSNIYMFCSPSPPSHIFSSFLIPLLSSSASPSPPFVCLSLFNLTLPNCHHVLFPSSSCLLSFTSTTINSPFSLIFFPFDVSLSHTHSCFSKCSNSTQFQTHLLFYIFFFWLTFPHAVHSLACSPSLLFIHVGFSFFWSSLLWIFLKFFMCFNASLITPHLLSPYLSSFALFFVYSILGDCLSTQKKPESSNRAHEC